MDEREREDWERRLKEIPPKKAERATWASHIRGLSIDEMNGFGVDKPGNIYWHGYPIQVRRKIELRWYELVLATLATTGALMQGIAAMFPMVPEAIKRLFS